MWQTQDKHVCCKACLGSKHALMTLSSRARLLLEERQRRADAVVTLIDNDDLTFSQDMNSVEETLDFFDIARALESHYLAPSRHTILPPFIWLRWSSSLGKLSYECHQ